MPCRGTCGRHRVSKPGRSGRYAAGQVRCQQCGVWMVRDGHACPCCGLRLRRRARRR